MTSSLIAEVRELVGELLDELLPLHPRCLCGHGSNHLLPDPANLTALRVAVGLHLVLAPRGLFRTTPLLGIAGGSAIALTSAPALARLGFTRPAAGAGATGGGGGAE